MILNVSDIRTRMTNKIEEDRVGYVGGVMIFIMVAYMLSTMCLKYLYGRVVVKKTGHNDKFDVQIQDVIRCNDYFYANNIEEYGIKYSTTTLINSLIWYKVPLIFSTLIKLVKDLLFIAQFYLILISESNPGLFKYTTSILKAFNMEYKELFGSLEKLVAEFSQFIHSRMSKLKKEDEPKFYTNFIMNDFEIKKTDDVIIQTKIDEDENTFRNLRVVKDTKVTVENKNVFLFLLNDLILDNYVFLLNGWKTKIKFNKIFSYIPEEFIFLDGTVEKNLLVVKNMQQGGLKLLKACEIDVKKNINDCSADEKQIINITRALAQNNPVLLVDKFNKNVSKKMSNKLHKYLYRLNKTTLFNY